MNRIYLDNAATSFPKPKQVADAVYRYMTEQGRSVNRGSYAGAYAVEEAVYDTRAALCAFFGGSSPKNVVFTQNITQSLNMLLLGFLKPGDHVIVSAMEHNAVMRPLNLLASRGITFTRCPCREDGSLITEQLEQCLTPATRAVVMTHASNVCGTVLPLAAVGKFCRRHGLRFLADCAQTAGHLPVNMQEFRLDALAFTGHKGLLGPQGTGGFLLGEDMVPLITPVLTGGTGSVSHTEVMPGFMPDRFEPGTPNLPGILGLQAGLAYVSAQGTDRILAHEMALTGRFLSGLKPLEEAGLLKLIGRRDCTGRVGVVSVLPLKQDPAAVADRLDAQFGIETRVGLHCAPSAHKTLGTFPTGTVRFSFGIFNTEADADAALSALSGILGEEARA